MTWLLAQRAKAHQGKSKARETKTNTCADSILLNVLIFFLENELWALWLPTQ